MKQTIYCPDAHCESCQNVLRGCFRQMDISDFSFDDDRIEFSSTVPVKNVIDAIQEKGYRASTEPFPKRTFLERCREFMKNKQKYAVEYTMLQYSVYTFLLLLLVAFIAYKGIFYTIPSFISQYAWWIFYLIISVVSVGAALWHFKSYRATVTSMTGMMVGMTFGMQTGMLLGTILAMTNGLFVGGLLGMLIAVGVGAYAGKCCGVMGVLEGMMAGVMGGIMGGMIGTMFRVDYIFYFMPFFVFITLLIMWGLSYMLFEEMVEHKKVARQPIPFLTFFFACLLVTAVLTYIMVYWPKTGMAGLGG